MAHATKYRPEGYHTLTPTLTLDNAAQTIEWYKRALGAEEKGRFAGPDGKIMHASLKFGDSYVMVNDVMQGTKGPRAHGGSPASLYLYTENSDALFKRAVDAGAKVEMPMDDQFWGDRAGCITDPEGYSWWIGTHKEELTDAELKQRGEEMFKQPATH